MKRLMHYVSLGHPGGVERHLVEFVAAARERGDWRHDVFAAGPRVHPDLAAALGDALIGHEKYLGSVKLPARPAVLRRSAARAAFARTRPDVLMVWNRPARSGPLLEAVRPQRWLYWEHGAAWFAGREAPKQAFYDRCPQIVANSRAARRMLELRWGRGDGISVCPNAVRPGVLRAGTGPRAAPARPLRLGAAGRLVAVKGIALTLQALALLRRRGLDAVLEIAGEGPRCAALMRLAERLGVADAVVWNGLVGDMSAFFARIDCLVHPALREPFGLVCVEAAAHGCPVVAAAVDGLPEAVAHEVTGYCLPPELPLADYAALGGSVEDVPECVYDPAADALAAPRLVSPEALAAGVQRLLEPGVFAELSAGAVRMAQEQFDFARHVDAVMAVVERCAEAPLPADAQRRYA